MIPTIGRIVLYKLTNNDALAVNRRRKDAINVNRGSAQDGAQVHFGNRVYAGDVFPMIIVRTYDVGNRVNGQVFLDGNDTLHVTSVPEKIPNEPDHGRWCWPQLTE